MLTVGSLFAGIGGFDLGLERAGMRCLWQCEIDPYALRVLEKQWPDVFRVRDIRNVGADTVPAVDLIAGGFPCQDISVVGRGAGIDGERSGLWGEMFRVVRELRPRYVFVENVSALLARGLGRVLGDLASIGYDAEWDCIPASAVGAPHQRDRVWLVAYPGGSRRRQDTGGASRDEGAYEGRPAQDDHEPDGDGQGCGTGHVADADSEPVGWLAIARAQCDQWAVEPDVGRVAHGIPARMDRLRCLGNAIVPQIAELVGRRIIEWESA